MHVDVFSFASLTDMYCSIQIDWGVDDVEILRQHILMLRFLYKEFGICSLLQTSKKKRWPQCGGFMVSISKSCSPFNGWASKIFCRAWSLRNREPSPRIFRKTAAETVIGQGHGTHSQSHPRRVESISQYIYIYICICIWYDMCLYNW